MKSERQNFIEPLNQSQEIGSSSNEDLKSKSEISMKDSTNNVSPEFSKLLRTLGLDKNPI